MYDRQGPATTPEPCHPRQVLGDDAVAAVLLEVHDHVRRAVHPQHLRRALAPFRAVLELLHDRVTAAATFAYATHILLQLMTLRCAKST